MSRKKHFRGEPNQVFARPGDQLQKPPDLFGITRKPIKFFEQEYPTSSRGQPSENVNGGTMNIRKYWRNSFSPYLSIDTLTKTMEAVHVWNTIQLNINNYWPNYKNLAPGQR